ncbi:MAG: hypothetical protein MR283_08735, partial [Erysipelotrichaceae bacterium]|nr:hypothetical protein [Erysipelotrichaceae bacterium]
MRKINSGSILSSILIASVFYSAATKLPVVHAEDNSQNKIHVPSNLITRLSLVDANGSPVNGWVFNSVPENGVYYFFYKDGEKLTGLGTDANGEHLFIGGLYAQGLQ